MPEYIMTGFGNEKGVVILSEVVAIIQIFDILGLPLHTRYVL